MSLNQVGGKLRSAGRYIIACSASHFDYIQHWSTLWHSLVLLPALPSLLNSSLKERNLVLRSNFSSRPLLVALWAHITSWKGLGQEQIPTKKEAPDTRDQLGPRHIQGTNSECVFRYRDSIGWRLSSWLCDTRVRVEQYGFGIAYLVAPIPVAIFGDGGFSPAANENVCRWPAGNDSNGEHI